jgi:hypothetical protein
MKTLLFIFIPLALAALRAQAPPGNFSGYERDPSGLTVHAGSYAVRLLFYAPDIVRVDIFPDRGTTTD